MIESLTVSLLYILPGLVLLAVIYFSFRNTWQIASPNEALIVSGLGGSKKDGRPFKIVAGGGTLVIPGFQTARRLSLQLREAPLTVDCVTKQGIQVGIQAVCIYKVADDNTSITNAARRFLGQDPKVMDGNIITLLDGHLRSIIGTLTVEQLIGDRVALIDATREAVKAEIEALGLHIESLQIKNIVDPTKYIENLAKPHIAEVQKTARIAAATNDQEAVIAEQAANAAKSKAQSDSKIKQAEYEAATEVALSQAAQQGPLAEAKAKQAVITAETQLAQLRAQQTEQDLETTVRKPADAEAYRVQTIAAGAKSAAIAQAEAQAETTKLAAQAQAEATRITGEAEGASITAKGNAQAAILKANALAEAEGIKARAEALATNQSAVINKTIADKLPEIVMAAAEPLARISNFTVLNGANGIQDVISGVIVNALGLIQKLNTKTEDK